jgi:hypothetical protein
MVFAAGNYEENDYGPDPKEKQLAAEKTSVQTGADLNETNL